MTKFWNHLLLLALAGFALFFCSGCTLDPIAQLVGYDPELTNRYVVECNPHSFSLQLFEQQDDGSTIESVPVDSPLNGQSCSVSTENQERPFTISEAYNKGLISGSAAPMASQATAHATASPTSLNDYFQLLVPMLFPPTFPATDHLPIRACPSTLNTYLVNHVEGTVTSVGLCPSLRVNRQIPVRSNPLQVAMTPDGATALVTSYDSAINFIDTATDTVTFTMDTSGYFPSGIAVSPDGTRAYVTNYIDRNPALLVIDVPNHKLLSTIPLPYLYPRVVVVTPDGTQAWVNYYSGSYITIVDLLSASVSTTLTPGPPISMGMAFNPTGTKAFVAADPNLLLVIDTASLATLARITVGSSPTDVVVSPEGDMAYVNSATTSGTWRIDARKNLLKAVPKLPQSGGSMGLIVF